MQPPRAPRQCLQLKLLQGCLSASTIGLLREGTLLHVKDDDFGQNNTLPAKSVVVGDFLIVGLDPGSTIAESNNLRHAK